MDLWYEFNPAAERAVIGSAQSVVPTFDATGALAYDLVHTGGEWDYYDAQGAHFMGSKVA